MVYLQPVQGHEPEFTCHTPDVSGRPRATVWIVVKVPSLQLGCHLFPETQLIQQCPTSRTCACRRGCWHWRARWSWPPAARRCCPGTPRPLSTCWPTAPGPAPTCGRPSSPVRTLSLRAGAACSWLLLNSARLHLARCAAGFQHLRMAWVVPLLRTHTQTWSHPSSVRSKAFGALPSHPACACAAGITMFKSLPRQVFGRLQVRKHH